MATPDGVGSAGESRAGSRRGGRSLFMAVSRASHWRAVGVEVTSAGSGGVISAALFLTEARSARTRKAIPAATTATTRRPSSSGEPEVKKARSDSMKWLSIRVFRLSARKGRLSTGRPFENARRPNLVQPGAPTNSRSFSLSEE